MSLPSRLGQRMKGLLGPEYEALAEAMGGVPFRGLRANLLKISPRALLERVGGSSRSAGQPVASTHLLRRGLGDRVLDLCGAPGGKLTHLVGLMGGRGLMTCQTRILEFQHEHNRRPKPFNWNFTRDAMINWLQNKAA